MGRKADDTASRADGHAQMAAKRLDNCLVFYLPRSDGVSIVRVLHAARDWWRLLGIEN